MIPHHYDGMVSQTADGRMRYRVYEPRPWQLLRRLRWLWWRVLSRFTTRIALGRITLALADGFLEVRVVAEPAPAPKPRRH